MESSSKRNSTAPKTILDLPSDLLNLILCRLDQDDLQSLSLVSKLFLVLSNHFIRKLTFKILPKGGSFSKILTRFSSVNRITIQSTRVTRALLAISNSKLNLEALKIVGRPTYPKPHDILNLAGRLKIKSLTLDWFSKVGVDQVIEFIQLFPALEELTFGPKGEPWHNVGIMKLSPKVPNIRSLSMGVHSFSVTLTGMALNALANNCVKLEHVGFVSCYNFTVQDFCTFLCRMQNLRSVDLPIFLPNEQHLLPLAETVSTCENLQRLTISRSLIKDDYLVIISKSSASVRTLKMKLYGHRPYIDYTMKGLSAMLCAFQGLTRLDVCLPLPESDSSIDKEMSQLVKFLPCLNVAVITSYCLIYSTLVSLIENCPSIECICILMNFDPDQHCPLPVPQLIRKNYTVKHISLHPEPSASLKIALGSYCPSLKKWDVLISPDTRNSPIVWK
ncbi:hypothetical protein QQ045_019317 [Rhodiola kirilowii]